VRKVTETSEKPKSINKMKDFRNKVNARTKKQPKIELAETEDAEDGLNVNIADNVIEETKISKSLLLTETQSGVDD